MIDDNSSTRTPRRQMTRLSRLVVRATTLRNAARAVPRSVVPVGDARSLLLCSKEDRPFLPRLESDHKGRVINYEELGEESIWKLRPRVAILLPFKRASRTDFSHPLVRRAAFTLRKWFCSGCHLVVIVPRRESDGQSFRDGDLRSATLSLITEAVPSFNLKFSVPPVAPGSTTILKDFEFIKLRPLDLQFYVAASDPNGTSIVPRGALYGEPIPEELKAPRAFETLAENELRESVVVTYRQGPGRITVVPRGMLSGELAWLNDAIPRVVVLRFPNDYRIVAGFRELDANPTDAQKAANRFPDDAQKSWLLINARAYKVPWRGRLLLQLIYNTTWKRRESPHVPVELRWPSVLADRKARENVVHGLRERLRQLGFDVLTRGTPTVPPALTEAALAGLAGIDHGWERWDGLSEGPGDLEENHQVLQPHSPQKPRVQKPRT